MRSRDLPGPLDGMKADLGRVYSDHMRERAALRPGPSRTPRFYDASSAPLDLRMLKGTITPGDVDPKRKDDPSTYGKQGPRNTANIQELLDTKLLPGRNYLTGGSTAVNDAYRDDTNVPRPTYGLFGTITPYDA